MDDGERRAYDGEWIMWMDDDAIFTDMNFTFPFDAYDAAGLNLVIWGDPRAAQPATTLTLPLAERALANSSPIPLDAPWINATAIGSLKIEINISKKYTCTSNIKK